MSHGRLIMIAGWAHGTDDLSPLCSALDSRFDIQATSVASLFSTTDPPLQTLPPASPYARALYSLVAASREPATLLAWSMGALVAIEAITRLDARVNRLIIVSGTARFCAGGNYPHGVAESALRAMTTNLTQRPDEILTAFFRDCLFPEANTAGLVERKTRKALSLPAESLHDGLVYLRKTDLRKDLAGIKVPTLIIHGRQDKIIPATAGEFLGHHIAASRLIVHATAGHSLTLDRPALVAEDIRSFMEG